MDNPINLSHLKVLIAEDQVINQFILKKIFSKWSLVPEFVQDGEEAVKAFESKEFDLIFLDLQMPIMGGIDATKAIRKQDKDIPITAITAAVLPEDREEALRVGMNDFIGKPFTADQVLDIILKHTNDKAQLR